MKEKVGISILLLCAIFVAAGLGGWFLNHPPSLLVTHKSTGHESVPVKIVGSMERPFGWLIGEIVSFGYVIEHSRDVAIDLSFLPRRGEFLASDHPCYVWGGADGEPIENPVIRHKIVAGMLRHTIVYRVQCFVPTPMRLLIPPFEIVYRDPPTGNRLGSVITPFGPGFAIDFARIGPMDPTRKVPERALSLHTRRWVKILFGGMGMLIFGTGLVLIVKEVKVRWAILRSERLLSPLRRELRQFSAYGSPIPFSQFMYKCEEYGTILPPEHLSTFERIREGEAVDDEAFQKLIAALDAVMVEREKEWKC